MYLGEGDCDDNDDCWGSLICADRDGGGIPGLIISGGPSAHDYCYCEEWPICPYGARDGDTSVDAAFSHDPVRCDNDQFIDSV